MLLHTLALVVVAHASSVSGSLELLTFTHTDPASGQTLQCHRCKAGHYMRAPCTPREQTLCLPCPENHYTQFDNYLPKCLYCSTFCGEHQVVARECSAVNDRVCECKTGYYMLADFCVKHRDCHPGQGVKQRGNGVRNTECEECPSGTFSDEKSSTAPCVSHTGCADRRVALQGTEWHDNICMSCHEQKAQGVLAPLRPILSTFLSYKRLRLGKLRKLARNTQGLRVERRQVSRGRRGNNDVYFPPSVERSRLLTAVHQWAESAPESVLRQLVHRLKEEVFDTGLDLELLISDIEEQMRLCDAEEERSHLNHLIRHHHHRGNSTQLL
ncbi:tumor necrosis factor receptor superfamily member 6B-like isoform X2 [Engraulis encrasicolus]|uniref:tumor necrosis factor receptor superfamily member 6B-like isoform X2 n=1 Tax=Engraulis encrasicolus TaxID=184585 RepID=UPI002FD0FD1F